MIRYHGRLRDVEPARGRPLKLTVPKLPAVRRAGEVGDAVAEKSRRAVREVEDDHPRAIRNRAATQPPCRGAMPFDEAGEVRTAHRGIRPIQAGNSDYDEPWPSRFPLRLEVGISPRNFSPNRFIEPTRYETPDATSGGAGVGCGGTRGTRRASRVRVIREGSARNRGPDKSERDGHESKPTHGTLVQHHTKLVYVAGFLPPRRLARHRGGGCPERERYAGSDAS